MDVSRHLTGSWSLTRHLTEEVIVVGLHSGQDILKKYSSKRVEYLKDGQGR